MFCGLSTVFLPRYLSGGQERNDPKASIHCCGSQSGDLAKDAGDAGDLWLDELQNVFSVYSQQCGDAWIVPILKKIDVL